MASAESLRADGAAERGSATKGAFGAHFLEMVLVMFVGMGLFGAITLLTFTAAGSSLTEQAGELRVTVMGFSMAAPLAVMSRHVGRECDDTI